MAKDQGRPDGTWASITVIAAALLCLAVLGSAEGATGGAETLFLVRLGLPTLLAIVALSRRDARITTVTALAFVASALFIPAGPSRLAAVTLTLVAGAAIALYRSVAAGEEPSWWRIGLGLVALRLLWRPTLLLSGLEMRTLAERVLLPILLLTVALWLLSRERGRGGTAVAAMLAILVGGGPTLTVTAAIVVVATASLLVMAWHGTLARPWSLLGVGVLIAAWAWDPRWALMGAVVCAVTWLTPRWGVAALVAALGILINTPFFDGGSTSSQLPLLWLLPLLLPAGLLTRRRPGVLTTARALLLALFGVLLLPGIGGLAVALAWLALRLETTTESWRLQLSWTGLLFLLSTLLSTLPWSRPLPLSSTFDLLGLGSGMGSAIALLVIFASLVGLSRTVPLRGIQSTGIGIGLLAASALVALPRPTTAPLSVAPFQLDFQHPARALEIEGGLVNAVVVDSMLTNTQALGPGATVGHLELRDADGSLLQALPLRHGIETGEWSRTTGRAKIGLTWVASNGPFPGARLGRSYRHRWDLGEPIAASKLRWVRNPHLPAEVTLVIRRVEVAP
ncbi:MAG: hypothetical protein K8J08_21235 [Thermoanaerobaculia bacterium]|nr:hypothetical protein [Thermoanaerobaculia bacterium]